MTTVNEYLERLAEHPSEVIAAPSRVPLTSQQLLAQANYIAQSFGAMGVGPNDRVAIILPNGPEMAAVLLGTMTCATAAPVNPALRRSEFELYLRDLNAKALIVQADSQSEVKQVAQVMGLRTIEIAPDLNDAAGVFQIRGAVATGSAYCPRRQPGDVALILPTSGTTSRSKLVPLTHSNICTSAQNIRDALSLNPTDRCLNVMPLFHVHGIINTLLSTISAGAKFLATPGFDVTKFFGWLEELRPSWFSAVPTMHQAILAQARFHGQTIEQCHLRFVRSSSASLPPRVLAELEKVFRAPVIEAYGMTEIESLASNPLPPRRQKSGSVGLPAGPDVVILDPDGKLIPPGSIGEIAARGPGLMHGYQNNAAANESAFINSYFKTGDQGYFDADGYLFITGRLKEIINRGGEKISPREVDEVLLDHPAVAQAVTFGVPHPQLGEDIAAAIVLRDSASATASDIRDFAGERLADFKIPRKVIFVDEIPKGPSGKFQRIGLAEKLGINSGLDGDDSESAITAREEQVALAVVKVMREVAPEIPAWDMKVSFLQVGFDSVSLTACAELLARKLEIKASPILLFEYDSLASLAKYLVTNYQERCQQLTHGSNAS